MKLKYIIEAIENKGLSITKKDIRQATCVLDIGHYIKLFAYHHNEEVDQLEMVAHMNIDDERHYQDIALLIDIMLNMMSDFTLEQRHALYDFVGIGAIDTKKLDINGIKINYELKDGYIKFEVFDTR